MLPFGQLAVGSGVRIGRRGEKLNLTESSSILKEAAERRNRRLSARRASFSGLEEAYQQLDEVYQQGEELKQQERSRSRMSSVEREVDPDRSRSRMQSEERSLGAGGESGEDMMAALEEFRRRRGLQEQAGMGEGSKDEWGEKGKDWEWDEDANTKADKADRKKQEDYEKNERAKEEETRKTLAEEEKKRKKDDNEAEERRKQEEETERMLEEAQKAKDLEAAALRETLNQDEQLKFDEMVGRGMLHSQIMCYFMTGGMEEEKKEEIKKKLRCSVHIEDVGVEESQFVQMHNTNNLESVSVNLIETLHTADQVTKDPGRIHQEDIKETRNMFDKEDLKLKSQEENMKSEEKGLKEEEIVNIKDANKTGKEEKYESEKENNERKNTKEESIRREKEEQEIRKNKIIREEEEQENNLEESRRREEEQKEAKEKLKKETEEEDMRSKLEASRKEEEQRRAQEIEIKQEEEKQIIKEKFRKEKEDQEAREEELKQNEEEEKTTDEIMRANEMPKVQGPTDKKNTDLMPEEDTTDDQSILDEDETLLQDVEKSDMVEECHESSSSLEYPTDNGDEKSANQGQGLDSGQPDEGVVYVSIVDRMLGISTKSCLDSPATGDRLLETPKEMEEGQGTMNTIQIGLKVAMDRVLREKSAAKEMSVPRELASQLLSLSSANISAELKKSCSNIVARSMDDGSEKKYLLSRLEELLRLERQQVNADLKARRKQLGETRSGQRDDISLMNNKHEEELIKMKKRHDEECKMLDDDYLDRADNLRKDVELLENEMESMNAPGQLASLALDSSLSIPCSPAPGPRLSELESELQCCSCKRVCRPPTKIYQCPEGDLLCSSCLPPCLLSCPDCGCGLQGQTSRNKVLEKLAVKYFC